MVSTSVMTTVDSTLVVRQICCPTCCCCCWYDKAFSNVGYCSCSAHTRGLAHACNFMLQAAPAKGVSCKHMLAHQGNVDLTCLC